MTQAATAFTMLRHGKILNTVYMREVMGIQHPAEIIRRIRAIGHEVSTSRKWAINNTGKYSMVAHYKLEKENGLAGPL